jgi:hypothetical protein
MVEPNSLSPAMQRRILAAAAIVSFLAAAAIWACGWNWPTELAFFCRVGAILAVAWFAYDDVQRIPSWLLLALLGAVVIAVRWPKLFFLLVPALILLAVLRRFLSPR